MKNKIKLTKIIVRFFFFFLAFVLVFTIPKITIGYGDNFELIYKSFIGEKCEYQGFIEVWNVDTFEAGEKSKTDLLKECVVQFQKKNRGLFVMVRNLLPGECINLLASGEKPDLFSCGVGFYEKIKDHVCAFDNIDLSDLYQNYKQAGADENSQLGVAWCSGAYFLISTTDKLKTAKIDLEGRHLSDVVFDSGFEKVISKKSKIIYSVGFGSGDYICPQKCLEEYNKEMKLSKFAFDEKKKVSTYGAYADFLAGNMTILLGTQRDVIRLEGKIKNGKISNVIFEPIKGYNDLVQYFFLASDNEPLRKKYAQKFAEFMLAKNMQGKVASSGLISTTKSVEITKNDSVMSNITPKIIGSYEIKKIL